MPDPTTPATPEDATQPATAAPPFVSVVIPAKDEEGAIGELVRRLRGVFESALPGTPWEVLMVDDGSTDGTFAAMEALHREDPRRVRVMKLRANYGKSAALAAAFAHVRARGDDVVFTMDADLQDDPEEIPRFLEALRDADLVSGWKYPRHDPWHKTIPSWFWNRLTRRLSGLRLHDFNCGFKAYRAWVVRDLRLYGELHRYIPVLAKANGARIAEIKVKHHPRTTGKSKFGTERLRRGALDLVTTLVITRYLARPAHFFGSLGMGLMILGFLLALLPVVEHVVALFYADPVDWDLKPVVTIATVLLLAGAQVFLAGVLAELITHHAQAPSAPYRIAVSLGDPSGSTSESGHDSPPIRS